MRFWFSKKKQPVVCNVQEKCVIETCEPDGTKYWRDKAFTLLRSNEGYHKQFLRMNEEAYKDTSTINNLRNLCDFKELRIIQIERHALELQDKLTKSLELQDKLTKLRARRRKK